MSKAEERAQHLLDAIYDEVDQRLNPSGEDCWYCGGEGETYDCIDGCCVNAEDGCSDCREPCRECRINAGLRAKAVREQVILLGDVDVAIAWLKSVKRWHEDITTEHVRQQLETGRTALVINAAPPPEDKL